MLPGRLWMSCSTFPSLCFYICKMGMVSSSSEGYGENAGS